jgi:hypothetical protein
LAKHNPFYDLGSSLAGGDAISFSSVFTTTTGTGKAKAQIFFWHNLRHLKSFCLFKNSLKILQILASNKIAINGQQQQIHCYCSPDNRASNCNIILPKSRIEKATLGLLPSVGVGPFTESVAAQLHLLALF